MILFLALLSAGMMAVCYFLLNHSFKEIYKKILKFYFYIFAVCAFSFSSFSVYQVKDEWYPPLYRWVNEQKEVVYALGTKTEKAAADSVLLVIQDRPLKEQVQLDVGMIGQYPELPRGCEVTSLAMLLQYHEINVDKMELAEKVKKDPTPFRHTENGTFFGNPETGFVGDMYSLVNPGYGVYHQPIAELAEQYAGDRVKDFSGGYFYEALKHLNEGRPVWIITNTTFEVLPESQFTTWQTPTGEVSITRKEHAVVLTGYDEHYIYFNDPITEKKTKAPIESFEKAWVQMGKQAITIVQS